MGEEIPVEIDVLRALAHPVRWGDPAAAGGRAGHLRLRLHRVLRRVAADDLGSPEKVLREAGLVTSKRMGTTICYSIAPGRADEARRPAGPDGRHRRRRGRRAFASATGRRRGRSDCRSRRCRRASQRPSDLDEVSEAGRPWPRGRPMPQGRRCRGIRRTGTRTRSGISSPRAVMIRSNIGGSPLASPSATNPSARPSIEREAVNRRTHLSSGGHRSSSSRAGRADLGGLAAPENPKFQPWRSSTSASATVSSANMRTAMVAEV